MKPNWKDAPPWAMYLAQDSSGIWFWFEDLPRMRDAIWAPSFGRYESISDEFIGWKKTLEKRP